jgi:RES domain-containing protein
MTTFKSSHDFYSFNYRVEYQSRYIRSSEDEDFLRALLATGKSRERSLSSNKVLWRAQIGNDWLDGDDDNVEAVPLSASRMVPRKFEAVEGRANPQGIPYLYMANDKETAVAEVRPWMRALVTVAEFHTLRPLRLVDCSGDEAMFYLSDEDEANPAKRESYIWGEICEAFSRPVTRNESRAHYAPTQIIAEMFRTNGLDGLAYKSSLKRSGLNIAIFDQTAVRMFRASIFHVKLISYDIEEAGPSYDLRRRRPKSSSDVKD